MEVDWDGVDLLNNTLEPSGTMHFVLQSPLLQRIALVKIVAHLWTLREIFTQITRLPGYAITQGTREWTALECKVNNKVGALPLPKQCKQQLRNLVEPLGIEIIRFCHYHCKDNIRFQFLENVLPQRLRWTMHGSIDYKKTAELIVKEEILDVERRYEIACVNCLEDEARELLFESVGELQRQEYIKRVRNTRRMFDHHYLIVYFTCTLIGDVAHLHNYFQALMSESRLSFQCCLFMEMTWRGNRATCEHLFGKLDQGEKEQVVERCALVITRHRQASSGGSLLYYLSMMNEEQQESMFRECIVQRACYVGPCNP